MEIKYGFNRDEFIEDYRAVMAQEQKAIELGNKLSTRIERIFFVGSGGAYTKYQSVKYLMDCMYSHQTIICFPNEMELIYLPTLRESDLVILGSHTGETTELIDLAIKLHSKECHVIGFIGKEKTPLDRYCHDILRSYKTDVHLVLLTVFLTSLINTNESNSFLECIEGFEVKLADDLEERQEQLDQTVATNYDSEFQLWITSGVLWGEINCYCKYMLEEIQWLKAQPVHSLEFFHGPLEIVDNNLHVNVVINRNEFREHDLRVVQFCERYTNMVSVIDLADFKYSCGNQYFNEILDAYYLNIYFDTLLSLHTKYTSKSSKDRRYYRKVEY